METKDDNNRSILLINQDPILRSDLSGSLAPLGFEVHEAGDSDSGIREFRQEDPFLVFLDLTIPDTDAADVLVAICKESPDTPVVLVTENGQVPESLQNVDLDAFVCLSRPVSPSAVEHAVRHARFHHKLNEASRAHLRYLERRNVQLDVRLHEVETRGIDLQMEQLDQARAQEVAEPAPASINGPEIQLRAIQAALDSAGDAFLITGEGRGTVYANPAFTRAFGTDPEGGAPVPLGDLFSDPGVMVTMEENVETLGTFSCEVPMVATDGREFHALVRVTAIGGDDPSTSGRLYIFSDITEQEQFRLQAYHDALTGLYSRRHFTELLTQNMSLARRHGHPLSLCLCDLDKFKGINDTHGHQAGDDVLKMFGQIISEEIRTEDVSGRLGGDEFCLMFPYVPANVAAICLERIRRKFASAMFTTDKDETFTVSATFGIADLTPETESQEQLIEAADQSLYKAKELGRNCTVANGEAYERV